MSDALSIRSIEGKGIHGEKSTAYKNGVETPVLKITVGHSVARVEVKKIPEMIEKLINIHNDMVEEK